jgi:hypothetical protein
MDYFARQFVVARTVAVLYVGGLVDRLGARSTDDKGQASTEYAGIMFVIVAVIAAVVGASWTGVGQAIVNKVTTAIGNLGG